MTINLYIDIYNIIPGVSIFTSTMLIDPSTVPKCTPVRHDIITSLTWWVHYYFIPNVRKTHTLSDLTVIKNALSSKWTLTHIIIAHLGTLRSIEPAGGSLLLYQRPCPRRVAHHINLTILNGLLNMRIRGNDVPLIDAMAIITTQTNTYIYM
jgi:hypothetical protein